MKIIRDTFILIFAVLAGCAKIGAPTGGPKDEDPPKLVGTVPKMYTTNFDRKKIEIIFDEFIILKDASQNLVVSPPMAKKPVIVPLAKSFTVEFKDSLRRNTTYSLNFGNSVTDNNEGNPFENFRYVFSTGDYIDSLCSQGNVINSFDLKADKDPFLVMFHDNLDDSAIYKSIPTYVGRSNAEGSFRIENMHEGRFHLFALKDANTNFKYDPSEPIAFIDSVFELKYSQVDTDTVNVTRLPELLPGKQKENKKVIKNYHETSCIALPILHFFTEKGTTQLIKNTDRKERRKLNVLFSLPLDEKFHYNLLSAGDTNGFLVERNKENDSLTFWVLDSTLYKSDSIRISFTYFSADSFKMHTDTIRFNFFDEKADNTKKKKKAVVEKDLIKTIPSSGSTLDLTNDFAIQSSYPIKSFDTSLIHLIENIDTLAYQRTYTMYRDSLDTRLLWIKYPWKSETAYKLEIFPGAITDYYNLPTDTAIVTFATMKEEYYGTLILKVKHVHSPVIIQLIDKSMLQERFITTDTTIRFTMLKPATYSFKAIFDDNRNRKWDTGNMKDKKQPEKVAFNKETVQVRSNWDVESIWDLSAKEEIRKSTMDASVKPVKKNESSR